MGESPTQPMTHLEEFLRGGKSLDDLEARYAIRSARHPRYPHLVLLKYNQIESPFAEAVVREARGIILDESRGWEPVARAFDKFFNHGEPLADPIDWSTARVQEKLDGTLCVLYHFDGAWQVSTSGSPDAGGPVGASSQTFAELFWEVFRESGLPLPPDERRSWMLELTAPENRVVVAHRERRLTLIGCRDQRTGEEFPVGAFAGLYPVVRSFPLTSFDEVLASFDRLDPLAQEGYVVVDGAFRRVKIKHPRYVAIHHLKDGFCPRRMVELVRTGECSELVAHFPEFAAQLAEVQARYEKLVERIERDYEELRAIPAQKDFALAALQRVCSGALFDLRKGKSKTVKVHLAAMNVKNLMEMLEVRDEPPRPVEEA